MNTCPELEDYKFEKRCSVKTCSMYTEKTARRCMAMDVKFSPGRVISDKEIRYYKFQDKPLKDVTAIRKLAIRRVEAILALDAFVQRLEDRGRRVSVAVMPEKVKTAFVKALRSRPARMKLLNMRKEMLPLVFDTAVAEELNIDLHKYGIANLFDLTNAEYKLLVEYFTRKGGTKGLF